MGGLAVLCFCHIEAIVFIVVKMSKTTHAAPTYQKGRASSFVNESENPAAVIVYMHSVKMSYPTEQ